ncbi:MAG: cation transporter [Firmicutes bacterium]|jgi:cation diffusion facilitator family transporter|nr:cation transporter [Bacillota bacterium]
MGRLHEWAEGQIDRLLAKLVRGQEASRGDVRRICGYLESWVSIAVNLVLFVLKYVLGTAINSVSLIADAFHTLSDMATSFVVLLGFRAAAKDPDEQHPYGHGRVEIVATLVIAVLLILVGLDFFKSSAKRLLEPEPVGGGLIIAGIMVASGLIKEALFFFSASLGRRIDSSALIADAWHHRSDAIASGLVAISVVAAMFGYNRVDAVFGLVVSALILHTGISLGRDSVSQLIGEGPDEEVLSRIRQHASSVDGVTGVHGIQVHDYGDRRLVSLHVTVEPHLSVEVAHSIATEVEQVVATNLDAHATVHIEPTKKS